MNKLARVLLIAAFPLFLLVNPVRALSGTSPQTTTSSQPDVDERPGAVIGTVLDGEYGEPLPGANVVITGTSHGTSTDLNGTYTLGNLEAGIYNLTYSYIGYTPVTVQEVEVASGEQSTLDVTLHPESLGLEEVVVEARMIRNTEAALLADRQKAASMSNAISAEAIGKSGAGSAADAMEKVTGATVVDGSFVHVRGLGSRYVNTQLNGADLPSAVPNKKAVPFDLFPADLLQNIVTTKTFTPDQPGNFTGGNVDINTKTYPAALSLTLSTSASHNSQVGIGDNLLLYSGGNLDGIGTGDDLRLPPALADAGTTIPSIGEAFTDREQADELDRLSRAFTSSMIPTFVEAPINQSYSVSVGNKLSLFGRPIGLVGSLTYDREASGYTSGISAQYELPGDVNTSTQLAPNYIVADTYGKDKLLWGGLATLSYMPHPRHEVSATYMHNQSTISSGRYQVGTLPRDLGEDTIWESRELAYVDRTLRSYQLKGEHSFGSGRGFRLNWNTALSSTEQDEPNRRYFLNDYTPFERGGQVDTAYAIRGANYLPPTRFFRNLRQDNWTSSANVTVPASIWSGRTAEIKTGGSYSAIDRIFSERRFSYRQDALSYQGDPSDFFSDANTGLLEEESTASFFRFGNYLIDATTPGSSYDAYQEIGAGFVMVDAPVLGRLRIISGVRFEATRMEATNVDTTGSLTAYDWLPSVNVVYGLRDNMNVRAAYGRTLARPTFREFAPYASYQFPLSIYIGNPDLKRTLINNFDLRWEWFTRPGELLAASVFFKDFSNPIEQVILNSNYDFQPQNVEEASVYGLELEATQRLDRVASWLRLGFFRHMEIGGNLTLTHSSVAIAPEELQLIRVYHPEADGYRPLEGQSPYVINGHINYENPDIGTTISAYYHVFGPRVSGVTLGGTPDLYEQPRHVVDVSLKQRFLDYFSLKLSAKNLLNSPYKITQEYRGTSFVAEEHYLGRTYSVGLTYEL